MSQEPVKLVVILEGGLVQAVLSLGVPVTVAIVDYDADQGDDDGAIDIDQGDGNTERAWCTVLDGELPDPDTVNHPCSGPSLFARALEA